MQNRKQLVTIGRLCAVIGLGSLVGCSSLMKTDEPDDTRSAGRVKDDKNITENVQKKLKGDPVYKFEQVEVRTYGGTVQLAGFVDTAQQSQRAEEVARNVQGVTHLINGLAIKPPAPAKTEVSVQTLTPAPALAPTGKASGEALAPQPSATSNASTNSTTTDKF